MTDETKPAPPPALAQFAADLRALHVRAGKPDFKKMQKITKYGRTVLSQALNGAAIPTWPVTEALVKALGGDPEEWRARWAAMANALNDGATVTGWQEEGTPPPQQLPGAIAHFVGRCQELALLTAQLDRAAEDGGTMVITAIGGTAGIGKTALAVHWARQHVAWFPDGQLFVDLHGFGPSGIPRAPAEVIRAFLDAFHVPVSKIPAAPDNQAALYRSLTEGKRLLIVLDNARDTDQIRPLLPGSPTCLVLVTSRQQLPGLVARNHAIPISLDLFTTGEAHELLVKVLGTEQVLVEAEAIDELIEHCAYLPLAVNIAAARAITNPHLPLGVLVDELREERNRLVALSTGDDLYADLHAVFSWSYNALLSKSARLFRLLGIHPGPHIAAPAAASLAALPETETRTLLTELVQANLLDHHSASRYQLHDLLHGYATDLAYSEDTNAERSLAVSRLLDYYLYTAYSAALLMMPHRDPMTLTPQQPGVTLNDLADKEQALSWFTAEHTALLAAIQQASENGFDVHCWQLTEACSDFLDRQGHWHDWVAAQRIALESAQRLADRHGQARMHRDLGLAYTRLGRFEDAHTHFQHAINIFDELDERTGQARSYIHLSWVLEPQGRHAEALGYAEQALHLFTGAGHQVGQATALDTLAYYQVLLGNYQQALIHSQAALRLFQELDDRYGEASAWDNVGSAHHHLGQHQQAIDCFHRAFELCHEAADRYGKTVILTHLGDTLREMGDINAASKAWQEALIILDELGHLDANHLRKKLRSLGYPLGLGLKRS